MAAMIENDFISVDRVRSVQKFIEKPCSCSEPEILNYDEKFYSKLGDTNSENDQYTGIIESKEIRESDLGLQTKDGAPKQIQIIAEINPFQSKNKSSSTLDTDRMKSENTELKAKLHNYRGQYEMDNRVEILSTEIIKVQSPTRQTRKLKNRIQRFSRSLVRGFHALLCCKSKTTTEEQ